MPRWIEVVVGSLLALWTLISFIGVVAMFFAPPQHRILDTTLGIILMLVAFWCLAKTIRLIVGRPTHGGLMSPFALRVVSIGFLVMPIAGLFTGFYQEQGLGAIEQAATYFAIFGGLQILARRRATALSRPR